MKGVVRWVRLALLGLALVCVVASWLSSLAVTTISVRVLSPADELRDASVLGVGRDDELPDYRLELVETSGRRHDLGTHRNRSAATPIAWELSEPVPLRRVASLRLLDTDAARDDLVDELPLAGASFASETYAYEVVATRTLAAGLDYFLATPVGIALLVTLGIALLLAVGPLLASAT